jgi:D-alanyl-D-alanine carboxypeptidase
MKRRNFLGLVTAAAMSGYAIKEYGGHEDAGSEKLDVKPDGDVGTDKVDLQLNKVRNFDDNFSDDVFISKEKFPVLVSLRDKLNFIQSYIGYANYSVLNFDDLMRYTKYNGKIGVFSKAQLDLIDELFNENARAYGFYGERINYHLDDKVDESKIVKVPGTGQYVFKGKSRHTLEKLKRDVGPELILTSGVRNIVKQLFLFTNKAVSVSGNLSRASRSLAPPGHSFHAIGDFDVGMRGLGEMNFTKEFSNTPVYQQIHKLGYINIRYDEANRFGVRYEPWHIKVV